MTTMHSIFKNNRFHVKQLLKPKKLFWMSSAFAYDFHCGETGEIVMKTTEPPLGFLTKMCRIDRRYRRHTPFDITLVSTDGRPQLRIKRGMSFLLSNIEVLDGNNQPIGVIKQSFSPITAKFEILGRSGQKLAAIQGDWADWDFRIKEGDREATFITKGKGEGILQELLSCRDSYTVQVNNEVAQDSPLRPFIVAAAICIDIACNE
ncbi:phospholipid scramblase-related protein [Dyella sp. C11]|uniref:phospholipid scramblase-related protein n=1 Tax=Dyella sp. C11 TaxID=2126991 RepID=UPI000D646D84|nr:phospholipid scramblase-related protein [Dyella sp. C11]